MKIKKDKFIMTDEELEEFYKSLNKAITAISISIGELGWHFGRVAKILRDDKFYKVICEANKYKE
jgi:hypothetical protein